MTSVYSPRGRTIEKKLQVTTKSQGAGYKMDAIALVIELSRLYVREGTSPESAL